MVTNYQAPPTPTPPRPPARDARARHRTPKAESGCALWLLRLAPARSLGRNSQPPVVAWFDRALFAAAGSLDVIRCH
jgi:hypothetical protein